MTMTVTRTARKNWRNAFEESEFNRELQTETMQLRRNTREISLSGQGRYITGIMLKFNLALDASDAQVPNPGPTVLDICVDDLRLKGPKDFLETFCVSPGIIRHLHRLFLNEDIQEYKPVFTGEGSDVATSEIIIPVYLDQKKGYYSLIVDADLSSIAALYTADVTVDTCTMTINIISTDTPPQFEFSIQSQSLLLPVAGRANVTTLYQGFYRESLSIVGEWYDYACADGDEDAQFGTPNFDTIEYQLPSGRSIITADMEQIRFNWFMKSRVHRDGDGAQPTCNDLERFITGNDLPSSSIRGETVMDLSYIGTDGLEPWNDSGLFSIQTVTNAGTQKQPDIMEVLIKTIIAVQSGEVAPSAGGVKPPLLPGGLIDQKGIPSVQKGSKSAQEAGLGRF